MLKPSERKLLIDFISQYADGDVLIQAANRVSNNLNDIKDLKSFIVGYKPDVTPTPVMQTGMGEVEMSAARDDRPEDGLCEDLGPAPKKLGSNGQKILKLMESKPSIEFSVEGVAKATGIQPGKTKPMMALLLERGLIVRASHNTYKAKAK